MNRRHVLQMTAVMAAVGLNPAWAQQPFPNRPIKVIVPNAAGSATDTLTRWMANRLGGVLGTNVVVENKPGANGLIATEYVAKEPADGHTLLVMGSGHFINHSLYKHLPYDSVKDFRLLARAADAYLLLVVPASSPYKSLRELMDAMRANPGGLSYGSSGNGSTPHMAGALLTKVANVQAVHIPYKRGDQTLVDAVGGQFAMTFSGIPPVIDLVKSGKLRALAVTGPNRVSSMPEVPTIQELGYPEFDMVPHIGMATRAGTPDNVVNQLSASLLKVLNTVEFKQFLIARGMEPAVMDAQQYAANSPKLYQSWEKVVRASGATLD